MSGWVEIWKLITGRLRGDILRMFERERESSEVRFKGLEREMTELANRVRELEKYTLLEQEKRPHSHQ